MLKLMDTLAAGLVNLMFMFAYIWVINLLAKRMIEWGWLDVSWLKAALT